MSKKKTEEPQESLQFLPYSWQGGGWDYVKGMPVFRFLHAGTPPFAGEAERMLTGEEPSPQGYVEKMEEIAKSINMNPVDLVIASAMDGMYMMMESDGGVEEKARDVLVHSMYPDIPDDVTARVRASAKEMPRKDLVKFNASLHMEVINFREYAVAYINWFKGVADFMQNLKKGGV